MEANFQRSLSLVLVDEGGLDDDPHDHGGRTAHGIIQREYDGYRARKGLAHQDVWKITPAEYTEIYHDQYWLPVCPNLPAGLDYMFFDFCVNSGPGQAARTLQKVLRVRLDGHIGEATMGAVAAHTDVQGLIHAYANARRAFYRALAQFPRYGRGWLSRVDHCERGSREIAATGSTVRNGLPDDVKAQATTRANNQTPTKTAVPADTAGTAAATTGVIAGLIEKLQEFVPQLQSLQSAIHGVEYVLLAITLVGIGYTLYSIWHAAKTKGAIA